MRKILLAALILIFVASLFGCSKAEIGAQLKGAKENKQSNINNYDDEGEVRRIVEEFGKRLKMVPLQAPKDTIKKLMLENYSGFVSQSLLEKWISDPLNAPGRQTSSPWPDRIEIHGIEKYSDFEYKVTGEVIEITSTELVKDGAAAKRPIDITVRKTDGRWLIDNVVLGAYLK